LKAAKQSHNYRQYALLLETGLRTGELIGLTWDAIDWKKHRLTINKTLEYRHKQGVWRAGPPKTQKSYRTIPLTDRAYSILKDCYDERELRKEFDTLSQVLECIDRRTGQTKCLVMRVSKQG
jgi:integrase